MTPTEGDDDGPRLEVEEDGPRSVSLSDSCLSLRLHSKDKQDRAHHLFSISIWDMDSLQHPKNSDLSGGRHCSLPATLESVADVNQYSF